MGWRNHSSRCSGPDDPETVGCGRGVFVLWVGVWGGRCVFESDIVNRKKKIMPQNRQEKGRKSLYCNVEVIEIVDYTSAIKI